MIEGPDRRGDKGPFDIIGDVHGCADELVALLAELGYGVGMGRHRAGSPLRNARSGRPPRRLSRRLRRSRPEVA